MTITEFVGRQHVTFTVKQIDSRPDGLMEGPEGQRHFKCRLARRTEIVVPGRYLPTMATKKEGFNLYFSQGSAHTKPPTAEDVLDCLAMDASGYENAQSFEDWASEYGYDTDSRKAEKVYRIVKRQAQQLKRMLGDAPYNVLLWEVERL